VNPFERHGIKHLSASHCNMFVSSQAKWWLCYLNGFKDAGASMWRGSATEAGAASYMANRDLDTAIQVALERFELDAQGEVTDEIEKELKNIPLYVEQAAIALADRERPDTSQLRIEHWFEGIEVPVIGYVDFTWPTKGLELKSTGQMKNEITAEHARQTSLYATATGKPFDVLYVTPKKFQFIPLEDVGLHLRRLEWTAHRIRQILSVFHDKDEMVKIIPPPDYDHIYLWKSEAARNAAQPIWG
jgi:hypothetical protein